LRVFSPIYLSPAIYDFTMKCIYRDLLDERHRLVSEWLPEKCKVVELCCGSGVLYERFLGKKQITYKGIDLLKTMTYRLARRGISVENGNVLDLDHIDADYCVMQGSFYHFRADASRVLRLMASAKRAILMEPIENFSSNASPLLRFAAQALSFIGGTSSSFRYNESSLLHAVEKSGVHVIRSERVLGGKYLRLEFEAAARKEDA